MKPVELLKKPRYGDRYGRSETQKAIIPYLKKDCVVAYHENVFGIAFLIKTKKKFMGFVGLRSDVWVSDGGYTLRRMNNRNLYQIFDECSDLKILNQEEWDKFNKIVLVENLKDD